LYAFPSSICFAGWDSQRVPHGWGPPGPRVGFDAPPGGLWLGQLRHFEFQQDAPVKVPHDSPAAALESAFTQVAKAVSPAVVNISIEWTERIQTLVPNFGNLQDFFNGFNGFPGLVPQESTRKMQALGSGFIITPDGFILTNGHVVGKADKITVLLENGQTYPAQVVGKDEKIDIALLKIDAGKDLPCAVLGDSSIIEVGQWAIAIGNPFGLDHTLTSGVISAKSRSVNLNENSPYASYIQTDASINPGNSGGPLCNLQGEVVGINTAIYSQSGGSVGIGFAIPSNVAKKSGLGHRPTGSRDAGRVGHQLPTARLEDGEEFWSAGHARRLSLQRRQGQRGGEGWNEGG
jgi:serine protease Do